MLVNNILDFAEVIFVMLLQVNFKSPDEEVDGIEKSAHLNHMSIFRHPFIPV